MTEPFTCDFCDLAWPHRHTEFYAPNGELRQCTVYHREDPRAEVRDPDTGEVIFPAVKGPLKVIPGGLQPKTGDQS